MTAEFNVTCPHCGKLQELHSGLTDENAVPKEGDISFCFTCGGLSTYDSDLELVHLTPAQQKEADASSEIRKATMAWLQVKRKLI